MSTPGQAAHDGSHPAVRVTVPDDVRQGVYANLALVSHSGHEFSVDLCQVQHGADGDEVRADVVTSAARHWLADVSDGEVGTSGLPFSVVSLAMCARSAGDGVVSTRLRSRAGRWLTLHAEVVEAGSPVRVSLVVEPTRPHELAEVIARAYGLSEREREVARMAVSGHSNQAIAEALWLSPWTVQDHLKNVFGKLGVRNRAEMTARMFFDQYVPRLGSGAPLGGAGWFVEA